MMVIAGGLMAISVWSVVPGSVGWSNVRVEGCRNIVYMRRGCSLPASSSDLLFIKIIQTVAGDGF